MEPAPKGSSRSASKGSKSRPECPPNLRFCRLGLECTSKSKKHFLELRHPEAHPRYPFKRHPESKLPLETVNFAQQRLWRERECAYRAALRDEPRLVPALVEAVINFMKPEHFRFCYVPVIGKKGNPVPVTASKLGGIPYLKPGEPLPVCGECGHKLILLVQIDLGTVPDSLIGAYGSANQMIQLFYCNNEEGCKGERWKPWSNTHLVRLVDKPSQPPAQPQSTSSHSKGSERKTKRQKTASNPACVEGKAGCVFEQHIIGWKAKEDDAHSDDKMELFGWTEEQVEEDEEKQEEEDDEDDEDVDEDDEDDDEDDEDKEDEDHDNNNGSGHCVGGEKLSGFPMWIQNSEYPQCPVCKQYMEHVFQISDHTYLFGDSGYAYITQCPEHKDKLAFLWQC